MRVEKPIFVVGTGRCGSTIFHQILSYHPRVVWLSRLCDQYPGKPQVNRLLMQMVDAPLLGRYFQRLAGPEECYPFWDYHFPGFSQPCRDLCKEDVSNITKTTIRRVMAQMLTTKRNRLLIKITGWPRVGFLKEIFPDAKFIHVYRDGRAVVNSLLNVKWWTGWKGPTQWTWGELTPVQQQKWDKYGRSFVVLAAIEWEILLAAFDQAKQMIPPDDFVEIRYEDLCQEPLRIFKATAEFSGLDWSSQFEAAISEFDLSNTNNKWQKDLSDIQQTMLNECLRETLNKYGYV